MFVDRVLSELKALESASSIRGQAELKMDTTVNHNNVDLVEENFNLTMEPTSEIEDITPNIKVEAGNKQLDGKSGKLKGKKMLRSMVWDHVDENADSPAPVCRYRKKHLSCDSSKNGTRFTSLCR